MRLEERFGIALLRHGTALSNRLKIRARHLSRDFQARHETPRRGHSNPDLAAAALRQALEDARLEVGNLAYLIGHTTSPACLLPPNIALVADRVGFAGPYMELRQACTGFANALISPLALSGFRELKRSPSLVRRPAPSTSIRSTLSKTTASW
jgi:3-oxoacyl-[acyl-carrier-protein] synthase-3